MTNGPLSWPPKPGRFEQWWYAPTPAQWLALPYHAAPRLALLDQWLHGFQQAPASRKGAWLERLVYVCEEDPHHDPTMLLTRFVKRMLHAPGGVDALLDMRCLLLGARLSRRLAWVVEDVLGLLFNPQALRVEALRDALCRLQWPVYFGQAALPAYLAQPSPDLLVWQFVHPLLQRTVLWLPLVRRGHTVARLQEVRFTHPGLVDFHGAGGFIHSLYQALEARFSSQPVLGAEVQLPASAFPSDAADVPWIKRQPILAWHIRQGAQIGRIQRRGGTVHYALRYECERLSFVQSEWVMGRVVRA